MNRATMQMAQDYLGRIKELEKENAELKHNKKTVAHLADCLEEKMKERIADLEKENAELKEQGDKWFVFETEAGNWGMDKATQYTVDRHNYFYGTREECHKWGVEHKIKDYTGHKYCYDRLEDQLTKAKKLLAKWVELFKPKGEAVLPTPIQVDTEQFLGVEPIDGEKDAWQKYYDWMTKCPNRKNNS